MLFVSSCSGMFFVLAVAGMCWELIALWWLLTVYFCVIRCVGSFKIRSTTLTHWWSRKVASGSILYIIGNTDILEIIMITFQPELQPQPIFTKIYFYFISSSLNLLKLFAMKENLTLMVSTCRNQNRTKVKKFKNILRTLTFLIN